MPAPDVRDGESDLGARSSATESAEPTRTRILVAASGLFSRRGYYGTSTRAIAEAVGIRQPSMFHHFTAKSDVMKELLDAELTPALELSRGLAGGTGSPAQRLARFLVQVLTSLLTSRFELVGFGVDDVLNEDDFVPWRQRIEQLREDQRRMIEQGIAAGEFADLDPVSAQLAVEGLTLGLLRPHPPEQRDQHHDAEQLSTVVTEAVTLALRMLLRDPDQAAPVVAGARAGGDEPGAARR